MRGEMFTNNKIVCVVTFFIFAVLFTQAQDKGTFSIQDSVLLFGQFEQGLRLVAPDHSQALSIPPGAGRNRPLALASLGSNGELVSWGFPVADDANKRWKVRCAVGVFSISAKAWQTHGDFSQVHATALSPDGSKVAFIADETDSESRELLLLDVRTGQITKLAKILAVSVSWAPDGNRLAIGIPGGNVAPQISIFEIESRNSHTLVEGNSPAWSPSGDWIAYFDHSNEKVHLVHPDGTGDHVVKDVGGRIFGYKSFGLDPVWSPNGTRLLLNLFKGDGDTQDVVLLDVKSGKMTTKSHNGYPVLGWAQKR
jgi:WD40 repeat protein